MKKTILSLGFLLSLVPVGAQQLLPAPQEVQWQQGSFSLNQPFRLENMPAQSPLAAWAQEVRTGKAGGKKCARIVRLEEWTDAPSLEAYELRVGRDTLLVRAASRAAERWAVATLRQLSDGGKEGVRACRVVDFPQWAWRGAMLDVSRHFFPMSFLRKQVDVLAQYKFNRLHLHLTDAAGWRMEIKKYPRLTQFAAWRTDSTWKQWWHGDRQYVEEGTAGAYGGYYTQEELRQLVAYAAERGITIIPEIEMPAHSEEVLTAYPELSCTHEPYKQADFCPGNEQVYAFLEDVLTEVMDVFPSTFIHVGGDEAAKASWPDCPKCQARMQQEGIEKVDGLQTYLIQRMGRFLKSKGRRLLGWDEIIDGGLGEGTAVMVWRGVDNGAKAADHGYEVIMAPGKYCYLDGYQDAPNTQPEAIGGYTTLEQTYSFNPTEGMTAEQRAHVKGVQGNLWTEYVPTQEHVEYMLYPRLLAIAEIGWNGTAKKDYAEFRQRALTHTNRLRKSGVNAFDLANEVGNRKEFYQTMPHKAVGATVTFHHAYSPYYAGSGDNTLTDGRGGGWNYGDSRWLGFIGGETPLDLTLDLGSEQTIHEVSTDFYQSGGAWIWYPSAFTISVSTDGQTFRDIYTNGTPIDKQAVSNTAWWTWRGTTEARYIRLQGKCSEPGGWIFVDEIVVK